APFAREVNPAVPDVLAQITARALVKAPEARFQSAEAMAQALETAFTHQRSASLTSHGTAIPGYLPRPSTRLAQGSYAAPPYPSGPPSARHPSHTSASGEQPAPYTTSSSSYGLPLTSGIAPHTTKGGRTDYTPPSRSMSPYAVPIGITV